MTAKNIRSLSDREAFLLTTLSAAGKNVFTTEDARRALRISDQAVWSLLHELGEKGWIRGIERGKYLVIPLEAGPDRSWAEEAYVVASYLVSPYAIGYWSALVHYNYTEQLPATIFISTIKHRVPGEDEILGVPFKFVTVRPHKFFGNVPRRIGERETVFTDREKTLVDCMDHPEYSGGIPEVAKALSTAIREGNLDLGKLTSYADRMKNRTIFKRLGYLCETLKLPVDERTQIWQRKISKGYSTLDPLQPKSGPYAYRWQLRVNVQMNLLTEGF